MASRDSALVRPPTFRNRPARQLPVSWSLPEIAATHTAVLSSERDRTAQMAIASHTCVDGRHQLLRRAFTLCVGAVFVRDLNELGALFARTSSVKVLIGKSEKFSSAKFERDAPAQNRVANRSQGPQDKQRPCTREKKNVAASSFGSSRTCWHLPPEVHRGDQNEPLFRPELVKTNHSALRDYMQGQRQVAGKLPGQACHVRSPAAKPSAWCATPSLDGIMERHRQVHTS